MKKYTITLILLFIIFAVVVNTNTEVTVWDRHIIEIIQNQLSGLPLWIPLLMDTFLYAVMLTIPIITGLIFFIRKYLLIDVVLFATAPLATYILNSIIKIIIHRPRPPIELQPAVHPYTYSFVSSHTFITSVVWGLSIYYSAKYLKNKLLKISCITLGLIWMFFVGFSRVWLGVHNPTDVLGGYFLAAIVLTFYIGLIKLIGGKC